MFKIVADSGSTKTQWAIVDENNQLIEIIETNGLNPHFINHQDFKNALLGKGFEPYCGLTSHVFFYGAGISSDVFGQKLKGYLLDFFGENISLEIDNDILGASIALFGKSDGIACILGTGVNSCVYKNQKIVANIIAPGYIFGDEGGGSYLGRKLLKLFLYQKLDADIREYLVQHYQLSTELIYEKVYSQPFANKYLASFGPVFLHFKNHPQIQLLLKNSFDKFIKFHILDYQEYLDLPIGVVGSIGYFFENELAEAFGRIGLKLEKTIQRPIDGLIDFVRNI